MGVGGRRGVFSGIIVLGQGCKVYAFINVVS